MAYNLLDIQKDIAFEIDGNASIAAGSSDWNDRLSPINRALFDWAEGYDWKQLLKVHNGRVSTSTGNASYVLPTNFRRMMGYPRIYSDGAYAYDFPIIQPQFNYQKVDSDKYVNILGNDRDSQTLYIHADTLASGASVQFTFYAFPASLVSPADLTECADPTYLVQRSLYYIYKSREDGRFPEAKVESERILARMIENENNLGIGYVDRQVQISAMRNFRVGRDG